MTANIITPTSITFRNKKVQQQNKACFKGIKLYYINFYFSLNAAKRAYYHNGGLVLAHTKVVAIKAINKIEGKWYMHFCKKEHVNNEITDANHVNNINRF